MYVIEGKDRRRIEHRVVILNSPVLTTYGTFEFHPISLEEAERLLADGFYSAVGHETSARFLTALLGREVEANRVQIEMEPGDWALVLRLKTRLPEGKVLTEEELGVVPYELGLLIRTA